MSVYHPLLRRQLKKLEIDEGKTSSINELLDLVNKAYHQFDEDRTMLERAFELSSGELLELNRTLHLHHEELGQIVEQRTNELLESNSELRLEIEERKALVAALRISEEKYRTIFENIQDLFYRTDNRGVVTELSPSASKYGYDVANLIGKNVSEFYFDENDHARFFRMIITRGEVSDVEIKMKDIEGNMIFASATSRCVYDEKGKIIAVEGILRDISERKRIDEERNDLNRRLEERIYERTREIQDVNADLEREIEEHKETEQKLLRLLDEKTVLLQEVHHRVKNNLQIVSSLLNLQKEAILDPRDMVLFSESQSRVRSMAMIHEQIYGTNDFSSIDFGQYLHNLCNALMMSYDTSKSMARLVIDADEVRFDVGTAIPCGLIVNELVSNSLKYAFPDGRSGCITVSLRKNGDHVCHLSVADDGIGMPEETALPRAKSLGLTLVSILSKQVKATVETDVIGGTRFTISFPIPVIGVQ